MQHKKHVIGTVLLVACIILFYIIFFGKLFSLSPFAMGFNKHELKNVIVFVQNGSSYSNYDDIDNYTSSVENFHNLKFKEKPRIYIFSDKDLYLSRNVSNSRFYAYPNNKLVVAPWAIDESKKGIISLEIYIKHELSHILLFQHMGYLAAYNYPKWLMEGIAVYSANQMGTSWYPSKSQTYKIIKAGNYYPPFLFNTIKEDLIKLNIQNPIAFKYSEFACIVDYLIEKYGRDNFDRYMKGLFNNKPHDKLFKEIYGINFDIILKDFIHIANK